MKKKVSLEEPEAFVEIGGYCHQDANRVKTKLYVGDVNQPLKVDDAAVTKRLKKIRVSMYVTEDTTPKNDCVYEKNAWMEQTADSDEKPVGVTSTESEVPIDPANPGTNPDDITNPLKWVKNAIKTNNAWLIFIGGVAVLGLVVAALALARVL